MAFGKFRLTEKDRQAIAGTIASAEATTSGEIVFAVSDASGKYRYTVLQLALAGMAAAAAVYLVTPVHHSIGGLLWIEVLSFALLYSVAPHLRWRRWLITASEMRARARDAAFMEFYASGLYRTRDANGVLIYLSLFERQVVVLGDRGIHEKMGDRYWDEVRDLIIGGIRSGAACKGICEAIERCGRALAQYFPRKPDDVNELPDTVIDRTSKP
ncbi:MAG: TPM domain-containing protein [Acidobacteria bacterium]|nr:TPM domain-containing protein [Acidobacteriota bacterium]